jgi:hypothetical protein
MLQEKKELLFKKYPLFDIDIDRVKETMKPTYTMYVEGMTNITSGITLNDKGLYNTGEKLYIKAYEQVRDSGRLFSLMRKKEYESKRDSLNGHIGRLKQDIEDLEYEVIKLSKKLEQAKKELQAANSDLINTETQKQDFESEWKEIKDHDFIIQ